MADYVGPPLHRGAVRQVLQQNATGLRPVLQIIDVKQIGTNGQQPQQLQAGGTTTERFRLIVSDGEHYQQAMLATQLNGLVTSGQVRKFSVVQVDECVAHRRWSAPRGRGAGVTGSARKPKRAKGALRVSPPRDAPREAPHQALTLCLVAPRYICNTVQARKCVGSRASLLPPRAGFVCRRLSAPPPPC